MVVNIDGSSGFQDESIRGQDMDIVSLFHGSSLPTSSNNDIPAGGLFLLDSDDIYQNTGTKSNPVWTSKLNINISRFYAGDGSDGDVIISANTTITEPKNYKNLTINSGVTLKGSSPIMIIRATETITINGSISMVGQGLSSGIYFYPVNNPGLIPGRGGRGGRGNLGNAPTETAVPPTIPSVSTFPTPPTLKHPLTVLSIIPLATGGTVGTVGTVGTAGGIFNNDNNYTGGTVGSAGAAGAASFGGGVLIIICKNIINNGSITANGQAGGAGGAGGNAVYSGNQRPGGGGGGGGGAGGAGGLVVLLYDNTKTGSGTITAAAGAGGIGGGSGSGGPDALPAQNGGDGLNGQAGNVIEVNY